MDLLSDPFAGTFLEGAASYRMSSSSTGSAYRISVSLPAGAHSDPAQGQTPTQRFPLLVVLDGCMDFATAVETARVQGMTGTAQNLIVVGVSADGSLALHNLRRLRDYTPAGMRPDDPVWNAAAIGKVLMARFAAAGLSLEQAIGGAAAFQGFLTTELLPELARRYPIDPDDLGLAGHSAGGTFVSHALLTGSPFHKLILGSFSLEMYGETLPELERAFVARAQQPARQVYTAVGGAELAEPLVSQGLLGGQALLNRLQQAAPQAIRVTAQVFPDDTHGAVMAHLLASGIRLLWPSGQSYMQALPGRMKG